MRIRARQALHEAVHGLHLRCEHGVALLEFAIMFPVLILLFLGSVELCNYMLLIQKLEDSVGMVSDVIAQLNGASITDASLAPIYAEVPQMMSPYAFGANGKVILTDVSMAGGVATIQWQSCGGGTLAVASSIGTGAGGPANLGVLTQNGFSLNNGEEILIGEIFYQYSPLTAQGILQPAQIYRNAVFVPRLASLVGAIVTCH